MRRPGRAKALRGGQTLDVEEVTGFHPGFAAPRPGRGPKGASGRKPKPGLRFEPVLAVLDPAGCSDVNPAGIPI